MRLVTIGFAMFTSFAVMAGDCPTPKPLSCDRILQLKELRCPPDAPCLTVVCPPIVTCPDCPNCPITPTPEPTIKYIFQDAPMPKPVGHPLFGGGPVYFHGMGLTAVAGYQFTNGWQILGGPMWIPQNSVAPSNGSVHGCIDDDDYTKNNGSHDCITLPYTIPGQNAKHPWGAQVLAVYAF